MTIWQCLLCEATSAGTAVKRANGASKICSWCRSELKKREHGFCPRCEKALPLSDMQGGYCKECKRERNQEYYAKNAEQERARVNVYRAAHPVQRYRHSSDGRRAYYAQNRTRLLESQRKRYASRAEQRREEARAYRQAKVAANPSYWRERSQREKVRIWRKALGR